MDQVVKPALNEVVVRGQGFVELESKGEGALRRCRLSNEEQRRTPVRRYEVVVALFLRLFGPIHASDRLAMLICDEENMILAFLNSNTEAFFAAGEICRKAGNRKLAAKNPRWALPYLVTLKDKDLVEADANGHYRMKVDRREKQE